MLAWRRTRRRPRKARGDAARHARSDLVGVDAAQEATSSCPSPAPVSWNASRKPGHRRLRPDRRRVRADREELAKMEIGETALTRTSPSSAKPPDRLPGRKYLAGDSRYRANWSGSQQRTLPARRALRMPAQGSSCETRPSLDGAPWRRSFCSKCRTEPVRDAF